MNDQEGKGMSRTSLPRSTPAQHGFDPQGVIDFLAAIEDDDVELHSLMVMRGGAVIAEGWWAPYRAAEPQQVNSVSKTIVGMAVGFALEEGLLSLEDRVVTFFPEDLPPQVDERVQQIRVRDLLTMTTGHATETIVGMTTDPEGNRIRGFFAQPVQHDPGSFFCYNSGASYLLSALVRKVTGQTLMDYLRTRLFEPLGIEGTTWLTCPRGIEIGMAGWSATTEDLAKVGQLHLQRGEWEGQRVLSEEWVDKATSALVGSGLDLYEVERDPKFFAYYPRERAENEYAQGYGYQIWRGRHGSYRASGAFGQFVVVLPDLDAVIVTTGDSPDTHRVMDKVWEHLLPAFDAHPADDEAAARMCEVLPSLELRREAGIPTPPVRTAGTLQFAVAANPAGVTAAEFDFTKDACTVRLSHATGVVEVVCGADGWHEGVAAMPRELSADFLNSSPGTRQERYAATFSWRDDHTLVMNWQLLAIPNSDTVTCTFGDDTVRIEFRTSVVGIFPAAEGRPVLQGVRSTGDGDQ